MSQRERRFHDVVARGGGHGQVREGGVDRGRFRTVRYDLIFANILEQPLRQMSAPLSALLAPGGRLVLSGLLGAHAPGVVSAYRCQGLRLQSRTILDGWVTLVMRRGR